MLSLLCACTEDSENRTEEQDLLQLTSYLRPFEETRDAVRGDIVQDNYLSFESVYPEVAPASISFGVFMTPDVTSTIQRITYMGDGNWQSYVGVKQLQYYLYGFLPVEASESASIDYLDASTDYSEGAKLTINGLSAVTASDICVIAGVQGATSASTPEDLPLGWFGYMGRPKGQNYVGLLLEHIYAAVDFQLRVDADYHALRHIKLKKMTLKTTAMSTVDVTIEIHNNNRGERPIASMNWGDSPLGEAEAIIFEKEEGEPLNTMAKPIQGFMTPKVGSYLVLESEYDVYDAHWNLVREGCTAVNNLSSVVSPTLKPGQKSVVSITIKPTYLYVLSEPDLDNPTIVVN